MAINRYCVFAHFDAECQVKPHVLHLLAALRRVCRKIYFVSTSAVAAPDLELLKNHVTAVDFAENRGYDFAMWQRVLKTPYLKGTDELILTNSSVVGPIIPLQPIFDRMENFPVDIWSMTDNQEFRWHLQSYFLVFRSTAFNSADFWRFWRNLIPFRDKWQTIMSYELGLSTYFRERGFSLRAMFPFHEIEWQQGSLRQRIIRAINPTIKYPNELIAMGMPYIKNELLRDNPYDVRLKELVPLARAAGYAGPIASGQKRGLENILNL